ncbi:unnamed protein product [Rotaria sp. Silwood2]|nr:unnamed protein product [Rotaria sp. Silwood2]CAF4484492.1 unnamed protein product [Rotaria sp. Silwood2]
MSNPHHILRILLNLTSEKLSYSSLSAINSNEEYIALNLYECWDYIFVSTSHIFEIETTLDHDDEQDDQDLEHLLPSTSIHHHLGEC